MAGPPSDQHEAPRRAWMELAELHQRAGLGHLSSSESTDDSREDQFSHGTAAGRQEVRDAYFGVADISLRCLLFEKHLAYWRAIERFHEDEVSRATIKLHEAERGETWIMAVGVFVVVTIAGAYARGFWGSVVAAVCGAGIGWVTHQNAKRHRLEEIAACRDSLAEMRRDVADVYRTAPDFTDGESASGVRDLSADEPPG